MELRELSLAVQKGSGKQSKQLVKEALEQGLKPADILNNGLIAAMGEIGDKFKEGQIYVPEMLIAAKAMQAGLKVLAPSLKAEGVEPIGKAVIGTVKGDLHDIGKNLVIMMLESAGFEVIDLGVDVPAEKFIQALEENPDVKIVGASALLTTTMPALKDTVKALNEYPGRDKIKVMVGGAPITQEFADEIGADAYTEDAASAAQVAKKLATSVSVPA